MTRLLGLGWAVACLLLVAPAAAQSTADSYFHEAAQAYVDGDEATARRVVAQGLEAAPSDPRLIALRKKLRKGGRPDGGRDSSSTSSGQRSSKNANASANKASGGGKNPSPSNTQGPTQSGSQTRSRGAESGTGPRSDTQRRGPSGTRTGEGGSARRPSEAQPRPTRRGKGGRPVDTLSRAQAERLLRALEGQERRLLRQLRPRSTQQRRVKRDW
ncbi:MAG: hypothetical protein ABEL97_01385 [Salinibacter sp.]